MFSVPIFTSLIQIGSFNFAIKSKLKKRIANLTCCYFASYQDPTVGKVMVASLPPHKFTSGTLLLLVRTGKSEQKLKWSTHTHKREYDDL
jgi:hypothetical protein